MCGGQYWLVSNFEIKNYIAEIKSAAWEYSPLTVLAALRRLNGIRNIHPWLAECWLTQQTECHADCGHWEAGVSHDPTPGLIKYCRDAHNRCWWLHWTHAESGPYPACRYTMVTNKNYHLVVYLDMDEDRPMTLAASFLLLNGIIL